MKTKIKIFFVLIFMSITWVNAQTTCEAYFPAKEGAEFEIHEFNAKKKLQSKVTHTVKKVQKTAEGIELDIAFSSQMARGKKSDNTKGEYKGICANGMFKFDAKAFVTSTLQGKQEAGFTVTGDYLEIPANPSVGQSLKDAKITLKVESKDGQVNPLGKVMNIIINIKDRKVDAIEKVTTKAGTFECVKISYTSDVKVAIMKVKSKVVQWYAKGVGLVKAEIYNKKGKVTGYSELVRLKQ